jgi:fructuronate reductase
VIAERERLCNASLSSLPNAIARPAYDRRTITPGILHLGMGAFHRAHQAVYTDEILSADRSWGIVGASLRSEETRAALRPQNHLYTLAVRSGEGEHLRVIGSVKDVIVAEKERPGLLAATSDPRIRIVSLTVTEKGYCHDPASGMLNEAHPTSSMTWPLRMIRIRFPACLSRGLPAVAPLACPHSRC